MTIRDPYGVIRHDWIRDPPRGLGAAMKRLSGRKRSHRRGHDAGQLMTRAQRPRWLALASIMRLSGEC